MQAPPDAPVSRRPARWMRDIVQFPLTRLVLGIVVVTLAQEVGKIVVAVPLGVVLHALGVGAVGDRPPVRLLLEVAGALGVLFAYYGFVRIVERRPVSELALPTAARQFGAGLLVALGLVALTLTLLWLVGVYRITGTNAWMVALVVLANAVSAAFLEEAVFRGFLFRITEEGLGTWLALAVTALVFGLLHLFSANTSVAAAVGIALEAGILLAAAYVLTRALWLPIGLHLGYNLWAGLSVPGVGVAATPLFKGRLVGTGFLSGGGIVDASPVLIALSLLISAYFLVRAQRAGAIVPPLWWRAGYGRVKGSTTVPFYPLDTARRTGPSDERPSGAIVSS